MTPSQGEARGVETKPSDVSDGLWEFADIAVDQFRDVVDDRELVARAIIAWEAHKAALAASGLTQKQAAALGFIRSHIEATGIPPTNREMAGGLNMAVGETNRVLHQLKDRGAITMMPRRARSIALAGAPA